MSTKKYFIEGFLSVAHEDAIQTLIDQDPHVDFGYILDKQAKTSLAIYAEHMFSILDNNFNLSEKTRQELLNLGGDLYIAAIYDPSYTFLDNEDGETLLYGNRIDICYYVDDVESEKIGLDFNNY